jgi:hypothetical protein
MRNKMKNKLCGTSLIFLIAVSAIVGGCKQKDPPPPGISAEQQAADAAGFKEFTDRVKDYVKLHNSQEAIIPAVKPTDLPEMINAHQQALARKIRETRPNAKQGDIFTPAAQKSFVDFVQSTMKSSRGENADATMKQGAPLTETNVIVNQGYPDGIPYTTVPPTLLQVFPKLPDEVVYRVVVHDLVLLDLKANLVVDLIPGIIPQS